MARAVKKSLHPSVAPSGFVALLDEEFLHGLVDFRRRHARADFFKADFLSAPDRIVKFLHGLVRASAHDGPGDVAEVAGFLRARENVYDDRLVGAQQAVAALVRVARLPAAGDDGVCRETA